MASAREISTSFTGDATDLVRASDKAADALGDVEKQSKLTGDTMGSTASASSQAAGGLGDLGGALSVLPGPLGSLGTGMEALAPSIMGVTGAADLLELVMNSNVVTTIKNTAATIANTTASIAASAASKAWAAAQWLLNAALNANPIGIILVAGIALAALFVLLWTHSETFRNIVTGAFGAVLDVVMGVWRWVSDNWPLLLAILTGPIGLAVLAITKNWDRITEGFHAVIDGIKNGAEDIGRFISAIPGKILEIGAQVLSAGAHIAQSFYDGFTSVVGTVGTAFLSGLKVIVNTAIISPINGAIDIINSAIRAYNKIPLAPNIGEIPNVPMLAAGGIVNKATLAIIGESGPEAVVPLGRGGFGTTVQLTVNVPPTANPAEVGRAVAQSLRSYFGAGGRLQVPA